MSDELKDQIKRLVQLQKIDVEYFDCQKQIKEKPAELDLLKKKYESKKLKLNQFIEQEKTVQVDRKNLELELQSIEQTIEKGAAQLMTLKTNKEYQAKLFELEILKTSKEKQEEKILLTYDQSEVLNKKIEEEKKFLAEEEQKYLEQKKSVDELLVLLNEQSAQMQAERAKIIPEIKKTLFNSYERILEKRNGIALVPLNGISCGGCFMGLTPQTINSIKLMVEPVSCDFCNRILYIEDDL